MGETFDYTTTHRITARFSKYTLYLKLDYQWHPYFTFSLRAKLKTSNSNPHNLDIFIGEHTPCRIYARGDTLSVPGHKELPLSGIPLTPSYDE